MPLDVVDRRMLEILQRDGRISNAALAEQLHLSPSPCLRRLRALERDGVITGYRAELDRTALGLGLTVFVELKVDSHSERNAAIISDALRAAPEVISAHIVSGSADFLLEVVVADLAELRAAAVRDAAEAPERQRRALELRAAHGQERRPAAALTASPERLSRARVARATRALSFRSPASRRCSPRLRYTP